MSLPLISVVVPVYGCSECLPALHAQVKEAVSGIPADYELILVDDAGPDGSWEAIRALCALDPKVKGTSLSRNFGQHYAICAGLDRAKGSAIVVMDCDLQDDPAEIPRFFAKMQEGFDAVLGRRSSRRDTWLKRLSSSFFYRLLGFLTDSKLDASVANFGIYSPALISAVKSMGDKIRFFPVMVQWVGFKAASVEVRHRPREAGKSSYSWGRLLRLGADVVLTFSNRPLRLIVGLGFWVSALAAVYAGYITLRSFRDDISVPGWASVIVSLWFLCGLQMIVMGIIGIYVGKIFDASKNRPIYLVRESLNGGGEPLA